MAAPGGPERIGRYHIEGVLGRGAMGVIYRAHDPVIDRPVAIKLVRADLLEGEDRTEYIARFQREAQAAGRCTHPGIVAIYDYALHDGNPYLAMEFIDGTTLQQVKDREGGFTAAEIVAFGGQILDALGAAHALGVVHRDIKPANVMLTAGGQVKVTDFGISRLDTSSLTGPGGVVGTPSYMSPEQCRGGETDARSDLFSVAVVLYELVTGAKPFAGASQHEVWHKLLYEEPPYSATLRPDAPAGLHEVLRRGLAKDPAGRFQTAGAMAAALRGGMEAMADEDRTVMQRAPGATVQRAPGATPVSGTDLRLDDSAVSTIERRLAQHVGPIARLLVRDAVGRAGSVETLCDTLVSNVPGRAERERLREELQGELNASLTRSGRTGAALPETELAFAQAELARFVGPIARLLVKRAAAGCDGVPLLWQRLAQHVDAADRARFLGRMDEREQASSR